MTPNTQGVGCSDELLERSSHGFGMVLFFLFREINAFSVIVVGCDGELGKASSVSPASNLSLHNDR